jgi:hypothetical protein
MMIIKELRKSDDYINIKVCELLVIAVNMAWEDEVRDGAGKRKRLCK